MIGMMVRLEKESWHSDGAMAAAAPYMLMGVSRVATGPN
jgi:hypothetical protein